MSNKAEGKEELVTRSKGAQADVVIASNINQPTEVRKVISPETGDENLERMVSLINAYHNQLARLSGISVSEIYSISVVDDYGVSKIITSEQFIPGKDIDDVLRNNQISIEQKLHTWSTYMIALCDYLISNPSPRVGIDAKPANFVYGEDGRIYYIDFYPPILSQDGITIDPFFPEIFKRDIKLMSFNFLSRKGILTKQLALLRIEYPELAEVLINLAMQIISQKFNNDPALAKYVSDQIASGFSDMTLFYSGEYDLAQNRLNQLLYS